MIAFWVILHGLFAIALIGAITHQGLGVWRRPTPARSFLERFRAVPTGEYANAVTILYVSTFALGAFIYPVFVLDVKGSLSDAGLKKTIGLFQIKEHVAVIGLALLPAYWHFWRRVPKSEYLRTRRFLTTLLMGVAWWSLIVGHVLNNVKGLV